jgi:hypothetical protein
MIKALSFCAVAVLAATGLASAQTPSTAPTGMRAQLQHARDDAKTASLNALSADHQAKVQTIVTAFDNGTVDIATAATQIDSVLTPDEATAVLAQQQTMRDAMRAAIAGSGRTGGRGMRGGGSGHARKPDAGQFLLSVAADPHAVRDAMRALRDKQSGTP